MSFKNLFSLLAFLFISVTIQAQYKLQQTLGAPYVQSLYVSHDKSSVSWVVNEKGARNIWNTSVAEISSQQLTNFTADDGMDISQVIQSGDFILFVRGHGSNRYGDEANPASLSKAPVRSIIRLNRSTGKMDTLANANGPVLSPNGNSIIYSKGNKAHLINFKEEEPEAKVLFEIRRSVDALKWSPNGNHVAFVSYRGDHSFVGVFSLDSKTVTWIEPSLYFDENPTWSPDGSKVAFTRRPGAGKDDLRNIMSGNPFEIRVGQVETGNSSLAWKSPNKDDGGFAQYYPSQPLNWTKNNKILFYSEHEDWLHLYAMDPDGSNVKDLIGGECEIENYDLDLAEERIYVTSNCDDINRRHIWQISISDGSKTMLTDKSGIQSHPKSINGGVAFREGSHNQPTHAAFIHDGKQHALGAQLEDYPVDELVEPEAVTFGSTDGFSIHGQLFLPSTKNKEKKPAVIFMHGGPIRQMLLGYHYSLYYANAYIMNQYLASQGYVVLSVNYRNGIGYGQDFRLDPNQGPRGASEYNDIVAAGKYLQGRKEVDPEKIGLWGGSYGGYLTAMGLARNSDLFKAGSDLHGVHDWAWRGRDFSPGGAWGITEELYELAIESSPVADLSKWTSPVLIVHGDDDRNVMFGQSIDLLNRLDAQGVESEILVFPDEVHGFLRYESWFRTYEATLDFFDRHLK